MARRILFITLIAVVGSVLLLGYFETTKTPTAHAQDRSRYPKQAQEILGATVQIEMASIAVRQTKAVLNTSEGIGTLISVNGHDVIVTHNHWSQLDESTTPDWVRFYDAQGRRLLKIEKAALLANILYRDEGTLIMRAPHRLVAMLQPTTSAGDSQGVLPGNIVHVARHQPGSAHKLELLAARVKAVDEDGPHVLLTLQSLHGETIEPGDSGGGIWFEGQLVGNMWMTVRETWSYSNTPQEQHTTFSDTSHAAGLPASLLDLVEQSLRVSEDMPTDPQLFTME